MRGKVHGLHVCGLHLCFVMQDYSLNMEEVRDLTKTFNPEFVIIESGGDNLAANYSRELADYIIYVIDVAGILHCYIKTFMIYVLYSLKFRQSVIQSVSLLQCHQLGTT